MRRQLKGTVFLILVLLFGMACNLQSAVQQASTPQAVPTVPPETPAETAVPTVVHVTTPANPGGTSSLLVYDVVSVDTAPERRAPYGDSYNINRLERPFKQDMTYLPQIDIWTYTVESDSNWWYVSIRLIGSPDAAAVPATYGVEIDKDHDGFGEFLIVAETPLTDQWDTAPVRVFEDTNHDTSGISAETSDAPLAGNGYDARIFNGGVGDADPDLAWVRSVVTDQPMVQFAFKKSWSGVQFMLGALADAGWRDPGQLDYVDRITLAQAGSPVRDNSNYPLKELFAVDNSCREAFGFQATGYEPQLCPREEPTPRPRPPTEAPSEVPSGCQDPGNCPYGWSGEPFCYCTPY